MKILPAIATAFLLAACGSGKFPEKSDEEFKVFNTYPFGDTPYMAFRDPIDRQIAATRMPVGERNSPCERKVTIDGQVSWTSLPTDQCVYMEPAKVWRGRWLNRFEHTVFCPADEKAENCKRLDRSIWLSGAIEGEEGQSYVVSFVGRKTRYPGGYGHLNAFPGEIIVDRLISIKPAPPVTD